MSDLAIIKSNKSPYGVSIYGVTLATVILVSNWHFPKKIHFLSISKTFFLFKGLSSP